MDKKKVDEAVKAAEVLEYKGMKAIVPTMMVVRWMSLLWATWSSNEWTR